MVRSTSFQSVDTIPSKSTHDLFDELKAASKDDGDDSGPIPLPQLPTFPPSLQVSKKRDREEWLASSSDAPLFSSDDLPTSSAENYLQHRPKRQHRRAWFEDQCTDGSVSMRRSPVKSPRAKGPFRRNFDSAVWLGIDESAGSEEVEEDTRDAVNKALRVMDSGGSIDDEAQLEEETEHSDLGQQSVGIDELRTKALQTLEDPEEFEGPIFPYWQPQPGPYELQEMHKDQKDALNKVIKCETFGDEDLDLS